MTTGIYLENIDVQIKGRASRDQLEYLMGEMFASEALFAGRQHTMWELGEGNLWLDDGWVKETYG